MAVRDGLKEADVRASAAAVEKNSRHPLALAVVAAAPGAVPDVDDGGKAGTRRGSRRRGAGRDR